MCRSPIPGLKTVIDTTVLQYRVGIIIRYRIDIGLQAGVRHA
jgi:hypothetical protein